MGVLFFRHTFGTLWTIPISTQKIYGVLPKVIGLRKNSAFRTNVWISWTTGLLNSKPRIYISAILSRFFMNFGTPQKVWPQISRRDLEDWEEKSWRFLPEICGQTWRVLQVVDIQRFTNLVKNGSFCQIFLPIFTHPFIHHKMKKNFFPWSVEKLFHSSFSKKEISLSASIVFRVFYVNLQGITPEGANPFVDYRWRCSTTIV